jgi:hypothetical protein
MSDDKILSEEELLQAIMELGYDPIDKVFHSVLPYHVERIQAIKKSHAAMRSSLANANDMIFELFRQVCLTPNGKYNNYGISSREQAQAYLIKIGKIKLEECVYGC